MNTTEWRLTVGGVELSVRGQRDPLLDASALWLKTREASLMEDYPILLTDAENWFRNRGFEATVHPLHRWDLLTLVFIWATKLVIRSRGLARALDEWHHR